MRFKKHPANEVIGEPVINERPSLSLYSLDSIWALFSRDVRLWFYAIFSGWHWVVGIALVVAFLTFFGVSFFVKNIYEARCGMIRSEPRDARLSGLPESYVPLQRSVIINMMLSYANVSKTISDLKMTTSFYKLYNSFAVQFPERGSNYIFLVAIAHTPEDAALLANTQARNFLDDYKSQIANQIRALQKTNYRNLIGLNAELVKLTETQSEMGKKYLFENINTELVVVDAKILELERSIYLENIGIASCKDKLNSIKDALAVTPDSVIMSEEVTAQQQDELLVQQFELTRLMQRYTDSNPQVIKQKELVKQIQEQAKHIAAEGARKVITGRNQAYVSLQRDEQTCVFELQAHESTLSSMTTTLNHLKERQKLLLNLMPKMRDLAQKINAKEALIEGINTSSAKLDLFLEQGYSDIVLYEPAFPPEKPVSKNQLLFTILAFLLAVGASSFVLLLTEAFNFRIRCAYSIRKTLYLDLIGGIPNFTEKDRNLYYNAINQTLNTLEQIIKSPTKTVSIALAPMSTFTYGTKLDHEFLELAHFRNLNILRIQCVASVTTSESSCLINDFLYGLSNDVPEPTRDGNCYFLLDEMASMIKLDATRILALQEKYSRYDYLVWNLFDYDINPQIFVTLCSFSTLTILLLHYNVTTRLELLPKLRHLKTCPNVALAALIYDVNPKLIHMVN